MGSRSPEGQPKNIFKKARLLPVVAATIVATGCGPVNNVQFPDCSLDSQTKTKNVNVGNDRDKHSLNSMLKVDEITFKASTNGEVDIFPNQPGRITVMQENKVYSFKGLTNKRTYMVTFDPRLHDGLKKATIVGTCETPQGKP